MTTRSAWDELAAAAARVGNDACEVAALSTVVFALEQAAGSPLGCTGHEPLVVLQRRFARAHRLVTGGSDRIVDVADLHRHLETLRCIPAASSDRVTAPRHRALALPVGADHHGRRTHARRLRTNAIRGLRRFYRQQVHLHQTYLDSYDASGAEAKAATRNLRWRKNRLAGDVLPPRG